jgi:hypothetical protein
MSRKIEDKAKRYLLKTFSSNTHSFSDKGPQDDGFDLWLTEVNTGERTKVELKATNKAYERPSSLFERLVFNADIEKTLFESGEAVIARVFLGDQPPQVFIVTSAILGRGASLRPEARYVVRGDIEYSDSYFQLT